MQKVDGMKPLQPAQNTTQNVYGHTRLKRYLVAFNPENCLGKLCPFPCRLLSLRKFQVIPAEKTPKVNTINRFKLYISYTAGFLVRRHRNQVWTLYAL